jgi:hypothetical protein
MSSVTAKFASAFLIGVAASAVSMTLPSRVASAADSCQTEPGSDNPQGKHWRYRIERGTGRHCWYLRAEDEKSARTDEEKPAAAEKPAPRKIDTATSRSIADAHAELTQRGAQGVRSADGPNAAAAPSAWPNPPAPVAAANGTAGGGVPAAPAQDATLAASRWPQAGDAPSQNAQPEPEASLAVADAEPQPDTATDSSVPPPPPIAAAPERQTGSIQKLALVALGALTLAGLTGSAVYRLGRRRRRNDWLRERTAWQSAQNPNRPPWIDEPLLQPAFAVAEFEEPERAGEPELLHEPQSDVSLAMNETEPGEERVEKIEEFLARLSRQLHDELESARPHNA